MADLTARYRALLSEEYERRAKRNAKFNQSAFARFLGLDRTYFSKLSAGKILLSLDVAERITRKLKLDTRSRAEFLLSAAEEQRCHALYLIDPSLTDCDPKEHKTNIQPASRSKSRPLRKETPQ